MKRFIFATLTLFLFTAAALAQSTTGRLVGTISGPDGVIPNATVTARDNATNREVTVTSSGDGAFTIAQLEFGTYTVTVTAPGFSTFTATELKIDAGREYSLNPTLTVGEVSDTVTVVAGADIINQSNGELSNTISPRQVRELPINGRNPLALLNLLPGVNATNNSINGQRSSSVNYTRDGLNVQDNFIRNGFVSDQPTVDDTGEFTVITQNAGAEFGSGSSQVQLVTPRGGQDFHGALYAFNRNSEFAANRFFNNFNNVPRPFLNRNQFGGTISGPSVLPRFSEGGPALLRGHAFFFANYEGFRLAQQRAASGTILLPEARTGNFTYVDNAGVTRTVNVLTGAGLNLAGANAAVFTAAGGALAVDPLIQSRILNNVPTSANGITTGINFLQTLNFNVSDPETRDAFTGRFDVQINDRNSFNFIYKRNDITDARTDIAFGFQTSPFASQGGPVRLYVAAYNMAPTANFTNEIRGGYQTAQVAFFGEGVPTDFLIGGTGIPLVTNPEGSFRDQGRTTDYYNIQDNATYTRGNHSFRFGGQAQIYRILSYDFAATTPTISISTTSNPNTPPLTSALFPGGANTTDQTRANNLRYLLGGIVGAASVRANVVSLQEGFRPGAALQQRLNYDNYSFYVSDQWRVTPRLTLNLGLRYELYTPLNNPDQIYLEARVPDGTDLRDAALNSNGVYQAVGTNAGSPGDFFRADKNNFGPNISFAYSPEFQNIFSGLFPGGGRTVIRGGFRVNYVNDEYVRSADNALNNNAGLGSRTINATTTIGGTETANLRSRFTAEPSNTFFQPLQTSFATPTLPTLPRAFAENNTAAFAGRFGTVSVLDPNLQVQRNYEYNIGIQRELGFQTALEIRYVGGFSNELTRSIDYNQIDIRDNGFLADFIRAQQNLAANRAVNPSSSNFTTGPNALSVLNRLTLSSATIVTQLQNGTPADLALTAIQGGATGGIAFLANPNTGVANVTTNGGRFRYNSAQIEVRRRFVDGFSFQINYTFQKILADTLSDSQTRVDPYLDNANQQLNYTRPNYDRTHGINANTNIELPFGRGRRFLSEGIASRIFGGFQLTGIVNISSGEPTSIRDPRGTLNRGGRSALQPATSSLTTGEIQDLIGIFRTPNGIYLIDPSVLQATALNATGQRVTIDLNQALPTGFTGLEVRGATPPGLTQTTFPGQVFFANAPGSTGNLPINFINGPLFFNTNVGLFRNFQVGETRRLQLRMEVFNVFNRANFQIGESSNVFSVGSTTFGRITGTYDPRIVQFGARFDF